jgi:L-serine/L-threonine ammonia-lyase
MPLHIATPLLESRSLSQRTGREIWLKMDALQPSGSFKIRGVGLVCERHAARGAKRFVASSGGNAGVAVAYAGRRLGLPVLVVVPESASEAAKAALAREEAQVIVHGASWSEANALALSHVTPDDAFVHPFDDPGLWEGHATLVDEVVAAGLRPDAVVLSVGGGGLMCGVLEGLHRHGLNDVPVLACETRGADSFSQSVAQGRRVELAAITSIAATLGARQVAAKAFEWSRSHPIQAHVVTDGEAARACLAFLDDHRVMTEPACGAALALVYDAPHRLAAFSRVLVVVCGGVAADVAQLQEWAKL